MDTDGNWGLEAIRAPQMWNLYDYGIRRGNQPRTGVFDRGFNDRNNDGVNDHPDGDLPGLRTWIYEPTLAPPGFRVGAVAHFHGQHVAGIIGARYSDGSGIEGVNPLVEMHAPADDHFVGVSLRMAGTAGGTWSGILADLNSMLNRWQSDVINISLGYDWGHPPQGIDANNSPAAQEISAADGLRMRLIAANHRNVLIVAAAGNDSYARFGFPNEEHAQWASPFNWAAVGPAINLPLPLGGALVIPPAQNILVVDSLDAIVNNPAADPYLWQYIKSDFSYVGGHISAPGGRMMSTVGTNAYIGGFSEFKTLDGTSYAAPHVTGLAGFLLHLDNTLRVDNLVDLLTGAGAPRPTALRPGESQLPGGVLGPAPTVDPFTAAMEIDVLRGRRDLQRALVNVDDGTMDGNQRTLRDDSGNIIGDFSEVATLDGRRGNEGTPSSPTPPPQQISMADFRAYRDAMVQSSLRIGLLLPQDVSLDGAENHFKEDLNFDRCVGNQPATPPASCQCLSPTPEPSTLCLGAV
jgi:subtilisin family serine protease